MKDRLEVCARCGGDACYTQDMGANYTLQLCYGCGFTTNSLMKEDSKFLNEQLEILPELYKDLVHTDKDGLKWIPSAVNNPEKGMVYADGKNANKWKWAAVKAVVSEENSYKMDMKNLKHFNERDYMEALDYIDMFDKNEI